MAKALVNLQDSFLNQVRKENSEVKIIMLDGSTLTGLVKGFDNFTIILNSKGLQYLIYKHAISQLISRRPMQQRHEENKDAEEITIEKAPPAEAPKQPIEEAPKAEENSPTPQETIQKEAVQREVIQKDVVQKEPVQKIYKAQTHNTPSPSPKRVDNFNPIDLSKLKK